MAGSSARRGALWAIGIVVALAVVAVGGWLIAVHQIKERIIETLGPNGSVEEIDVGFGHVTLSRVRLRGPKDWPASDAMRAERIVLDVDMHSLITKPIHLRSVSVDNYYLSIVRSADGRVRILPGSGKPRRKPTPRPTARSVRSMRARKSSSIACRSSVARWSSSTAPCRTRRTAC